MRHTDHPAPPLKSRRARHSLVLLSALTLLSQAVKAADLDAPATSDRSAYAFGDRTDVTDRPDGSVVISTRSASGSYSPPAYNDYYYESQEPGGNDLIQRMRRGFRMNPVFNSRVGAQMRSLRGKQPYIDRIMERAKQFMRLAVIEAERRQLPAELALLPVIESAYDPTATSKAQASGLWQFIPDTGKLFGLRQTWFYDGRRDPTESTRAAFDYFEKLYSIFRDWNLVLAAYNAGPGTVLRAQKANSLAGRATDYWSLRLPAETQAYVPRFLAVVEMFKYPERFDVRIPSISDKPFFRTVELPQAVNLRDFASKTGVSHELLRNLNPALRRNATEPNGPHRVNVPANFSLYDDLPGVKGLELQPLTAGNLEGTAGTVINLRPEDGGPTDPSQPFTDIKPNFSRNEGQTTTSASPAEAGATPPVSAVAPTVIKRTVRMGFGKYQVKPRETWFGLAKRFGISEEALRNANPNLVDNLPAGYDLTVPTAPAAPVANVSEASVTVPVTTTTRSIPIVPVARQQSAPQPASKPVEAPARAQAVTVKAVDEAGASVAVTASPAPAQPATGNVIRRTVRMGFGKYQVKPNETWYGLAKRFGITETQLRNANPDLVDNLPAGHDLVVPSPDAPTPGSASLPTKTGSEAAAGKPAAVVRVASSETAITTAAPAPSTSPAAPATVTPPPVVMPPEPAGEKTRPVENDKDEVVDYRRKIKSTDTLESIQKRFQVTDAQLEAWNGRKIDTLKEGEVLILRVPKSVYLGNR